MTFTAERVTAWYLADPQMWSFRPEADAEAFIVAAAGQLAQLTGRRLHGRVTSRPYPISEWAAAHARNAPAPVPSFPDFLGREEDHLAGRSLSSKLFYLGVEVGGRSLAGRTLGKLSSSALDREAEGLQRRLQHLDSVFAGRGLEAAPASGHDMAWLLHRSACLGLPTSLSPAGGAHTADWEDTDLAEFFQSARWHCEPYGRSVVVTGSDAGRRVSRNVVVMSVGRMAPHDIPPGTPWMARTEQLPFPVEWAFTVDVRDSVAVTGEMQKLVGRIDAQWEHYTRDHNVRPPHLLARQAERASEIEDELRTGFDGMSVRTQGWYRLAVSGRDEAEAIERAQIVAELYRPDIQIEHPFDQYRLAREFVPGEPLANTAYRRRFPLLTLAGAVPAATTHVGDRRGMYLGHTSGFAQSAVVWDPWYLTEVVEATGLTPIVGGLGSGKSYLAGLLIYKTAMQGVPWTVLDPSGKLGALCSLPELAPYARAIDLIGAEPGTLNPYSVVPAPRREHYETELEPDPAWHRACRQAEAQRRDLCADVLRSLLPPKMAQREVTEDYLYRAIANVPAVATATPWQVIAALEAFGADEATDMAARLRESSERAQSALFFRPEHTTPTCRRIGCSPSSISRASPIRRTACLRRSGVGRSV